MASLTFATYNQQMVFGADERGGSGGYSLFDILMTNVLLSFSATKKHDKPMTEVVSAMAQFMSKNLNATDQELADALGADSPRTIQALRFRGWQQEYAVAYTLSAANAQPLMEHERGTSAMTTTFAIMVTFATIALGLRIWSREVRVLRLMLHDWFMVIGFILSLGYGVIAIIHANLLLPNVAIWDLSWNTYSQVQMYQTILYLMYPLPLFFIKASLLVFYLRLCPTCPSELRSVFRTSIFVTFFFILSTAITNFFVILLQCDNIAYWDDELTTICKLDAKTAQVALGGVGVVTDILLCLMPLPLVWRLELGKREKILAVITFGLGAVACIVSAFRLRAIQLYGYVTDGKLLGVSVSVLTVIELNLAIICSCAPAIRALIIHYAPRILNVYSQSTRRVREPSSKEIKQMDLSSSDEEEEGSTYTIQVGINVRHGDYPMSPGGGAVAMGGEGLKVVEQEKTKGSGRSMRRLA